MLELKDISFNVQDDSKEKEIIRHLDLNIDDGKFVVVTGPNGGGKSPWQSSLPALNRRQKER